MSDNEIGCNKKALEPKNLVTAAVNNEEGALKCFRQEFRKLSEPEKGKLIEQIHYNANAGQPGTAGSDQERVHNSLWIK